MATCIFCFAELNDATKPEHILLAAFRGSTSTRKVDCSKCNNYFGGGIDKALAEEFADIRTFLQVPSCSGRLPPTIRNVKVGSDTINIGGDGTICPQSKPFEITALPDGNKNLRITASSFEEIAALLPHMAAALKISTEQLREQLSQQDGLVVERRPGPVRREFRFGGPQAVRSVAKSCLVLWATLVGNDEVQRAQYDEVRDFIIGRKADFLSYRTKLDSRFLDLPQQVAEAYGPAFNLIYIKSDNNGRVIGHFTLFNLVAVSVVLAESGGNPNKCIALISNPITGKWSDTIADTLDIPFTWLSNPDYDLETMSRSNRRLSDLMNHCSAITRNEQQQKIIKDVLNNCGLKEGDMIQEEMAKSISSEIALRLTRLIFNIPSEKTIEAAKVKEIFDAIFAKTDAA